MFKNKIINEQYRVDKYFIDLVFTKHGLGTEIDENRHIDRCKVKEQERTKIIKEKPGFEVIRINPEKENFDIFDEIGEMQQFIYRSGKKSSEQSTKMYLIDDTEKLNKMVKQLCI